MQYSIIVDLDYDSFAFTSALFTRRVVFSKIWHGRSQDGSNLCEAQSNVYESFWWHFKPGLVLRKQRATVPSLPAWLGLNRFQALLLMARSASSQVIQLQSHGKYLCTNYGKGTFNENCIFTSIVLVRWPKYSVQLAYWLQQGSCVPPSLPHPPVSTHCNCTEKLFTHYF